MNGMTTGKFPLETKFGTPEYWRDRCKKLQAVLAAKDKEIEGLRAELGSGAPYYRKWREAVKEIDELKATLSRLNDDGLVKAVAENDEGGPYIWDIRREAIDDFRKRVKEG